MSKPIIYCDFNGVISYETFWHTISLKEHPLNEYYNKIRDCFFSNEHEIITNWMIGKIKAEEVHKILSMESGADYDILWETFCEECATIDLSVEILTRLQQLKSNYTVILSTGNMDSLDRFTIPNNPILTDTFDRIDNSYNLGILKTTNGGQYFKEVAHEFQVNISNCIVIDDSKDVCETFKTLGGIAYCVTGESNVVNILNII